MNQQEFDKILNRLHAVYPHQKTSDQQRVELFRVLADYEHHRVDRAVDVWIEKSEYYPKPSNLLALVDKQPQLHTSHCAACDGSGWIDVAAPERDDAGHKAQSVLEQPWVVKCRVCGGSGRGRG